MPKQIIQSDKVEKLTYVTKMYKTGEYLFDK